MLRYTVLLVLAIWFAAGVARAQYEDYNDDFNDGTQGPQWSLVEDAPSELSVVEVKLTERLEAIASAPSITRDALYLSDGLSGFKLATDTDFEINIDYSFTGYQDAGSVGDQIGLVFGVGRDLAGTDSAAIGYAYANTASGVGAQLVEAHRIADAEFVNESFPPYVAANTGTFELIYDKDGDDLTLGDGTWSYTLADTVQGVWGADDLFVSFGVRGDGFTLVSGDAYLDNFDVVSGRVVLVPEPATLVLLSLAAVGVPVWWWRRRKSLGRG